MTEEKGEFTSEALPTQGGTYSAWVPEFQGEVDKLSPDGWRRVPTAQSDRDGIPGAPWNEGINATIHMFSFAQANALAWSYAAYVEAATGHQPAIRVIEYRVKYDIKCYRAAGVQACDGGNDAR